MKAMSGETITYAQRESVYVEGELAFEECSRAFATRMQQAVQHLNKSGGMAGTMAEE